MQTLLCKQLTIFQQNTETVNSRNRPTFVCVKIEYTESQNCLVSTPLSTFYMITNRMRKTTAENAAPKFNSIS